VVALEELLLRLFF